MFSTRFSKRVASREPQTGSALVIVLGLLSVLLLMGVAFAVTMRTERQGASNMRHAALARHTLDSALNRILSDLDAELRGYEEDGRFYDCPIPEGMVILASESDADPSNRVSLLSHEIARHLPSDQRGAVLYTNVCWNPIYGSVRISDESDNDPTAEDSPIGRYAYAVLNGCGYLDPNVVGATNRLFGLTPAEIQLGDGKLLGFSENGKVKDFISQRKKDGHYVTMRDFLRDGVTDVVYNPDVNARRAPFPVGTNCFNIGSMAVNDLCPPSKNELDKGRDGKFDAAVIRKPKCSLVNEDGELLDGEDFDADKVSEIAEAFENAFHATWSVSKGIDGLPQKFETLIYNGGQGIPYQQIAARLLCDALDSDIFPGGSHGRTADGGKDQYLPRYDWSALPCVEPIPMLDNLIAVGTLECDSFAYRRVQNDQGNMVNSTIATAAVWKVTIGMPKNMSFRYVGWNVPKAAEGTYNYEWSFKGMWADPDGDLPEDGGEFNTIYTKAVDAARDGIDGKKITGSMTVAKGISGSKRRGEYDLEEALTITFSIPLDNVETGGTDNAKKNNEKNGYAKIPDAFGLSLYAVGRVFRDGKLLQVAPYQTDSEEKSVVYLPLILRKANMMGGDPVFLGGAFCVDPMFAFNYESWIPSSQLRTWDSTEPMCVLRRMLTESENQRLFDSMREGGPNPLTAMYLINPRGEISRKTIYSILKNNGVAGAVLGGGSDVMWANPGVDEYSEDDEDGHKDASLAFYFDADEKADDADRFTRIGQLGFLPIGTHRTIALLDGFSLDDRGSLVRTPRQCVLDCFTMATPRTPLDDLKEGSGPGRPGEPVKSALFTSRLNINPPRVPEWRKKDGDGKTKYWIDSGDYNLAPMTAALYQCPLREWENTDTSRMSLDWNTAEKLAEAYAVNIDRDDKEAKTENPIKYWNCNGVVHDVSVLGRCGDPNPDNLKKDPSWDSILRNETGATCDFDREGVVRNSAGMFTARQQLFTILLKADSFTPKVGFNDASHGTSLASVQAIAHIFRDPEPLRDKDGIPVRDRDGNVIHPCVVLDVYQF